MSLIINRVLGALSLDSGVFEDIEGDRGATWQAAAVVVLSSVASGIGFGGLVDRHLSTFVTLSSIALVTWAAWAMLILQIGTRMLPETDTRADLGEVLRTLGFAAAPGFFQAFAIFAPATVPVLAVTTIWMFVAMVIAVRHALDYHSLGRAIAVCGIAASLAAGMAVLLALLLSRTVLSVS